jgi:uncharacterized protein (TIGR02246 family)
MVTERLVAGLCVAFVLAGCAQHSNGADEKAVRDLLTRIQQTFNSGNLDDFMPAFADDAIIAAHGIPDVVGNTAIRALYEGALAQANIQVQFNTQEIKVVGDLAYERGTYTIQMKDKTSGARIAEVENRHIHIFQRQPDGGWKTWRMMTNGATAPPPAQANPAPSE